MTLLVAINAKYIHSNLAIYDLKAYAAEYTDKVYLSEYTINQRKEEILRDIYESSPEIIAFSCYIWNITIIMSLAADLKKILPDSTILLGGPEVSYDVPEILERHPYVDAVIYGEGEKTFLSFLKWFYDGDVELSDIRGIAYRTDSVILRSPQKVVSMDDFVFPYQSIEELSNRIVYYETSRGCPFSCTYCLSSIEKEVRFRSMKKVYKELQFFLEKKVPQVKFVDRTFNCNANRAHEIWEYIKENDNQITNFHFEIAADLLREEDFKLFAEFRPGLIQLEIGVQSTNPETLKAIRRCMDWEKVKRAVFGIRKLDKIHQHLDLIAGLPYENYERFQHSFNEVFALGPEQLQLGFLKVLKGSYMRECIQEYDLVYTKEPPYEVLSTKWLSFGHILHLKLVEEMLEIYYNSGQFLVSLPMLLVYHETPFDLFEQLGHFYKKSRFYHRPFNRMSRYILLQEYYETNLFGALEHFKQAMTYDYYLREKPKSRLPFEKERSGDEKNRLRDFYIKESGEKKYLKGYEEVTSKQLERMTGMVSFTLDMEHLIQTGECLEKETYVLFDYRNRSVLNSSAKVFFFPSEVF